MLISQDVIRRNVLMVGGDAMKSWWKERDFSDVLHEVRITEENDLQSIVQDISNAVTEGRRKGACNDD